MAKVPEPTLPRPMIPTLTSSILKYYAICRGRPFGVIAQKRSPLHGLCIKMDRMIENWQRSKELLTRARQSLAGGVSSPFRAKAPVPLYFEDGCGPRLRDVDGNEYIDYQLAWGPMILGYKHPKLVEAMHRQAELPFSYGAQHELEISVAERIQRLVPCAERVAFTSSGSEAVQLAQRLARAYTGRGLILKFEGHYHGWMDSALVSHHPAAGDLGPIEAPHSVPGSRGQVANAVLNVAVAPWNRLD